MAIDRARMKAALDAQPPPVSRQAQCGQSPTPIATSRPDESADERPRQDVAGGMVKDAKSQLVRLPNNLTDHEVCGRPKQLGARAVKLLGDYYRRLAFYDACLDQAPVEWAGEVILGLRRRRSYVIWQEMFQPDGPDHASGPVAWFQSSVMAGMADGRIARGRETKKSPLADAFFIVLAGGFGASEEVKSILDAAEDTTLDTVRKSLPGDSPEVRLCRRESLDYLVYGAVKEVAS